MTGNHAARSHAKWSASSTAANMACPGRLAMCEGIQEGRESEAAAWGTACHEVAEWCLTTGGDPEERVDRIIRTKDHAIEVTDEMAEAARVYVEYVRERRARALWLKVEQKFSLASLNPPLESGGTGDAVLLFADGLLEVVDLKGGRGVVVEAHGNSQLRTYALGAMLANPGARVERVRVTIVQPRVDHPDGRIRSEEFHAADLFDWTTDLLAAMEQSKCAIDERPDHSPGAWTYAWLRPGEHCRFCPALAVCPAQKAKAMESAKLWFGNDGVLKAPSQPAALSMDELVGILDGAGAVQDWLNAVRAYAHQLAEGGASIPGYHLAAKRATRKWRDEAQAEAALKVALGAKAYTQKLVSPAQAEKLLGERKKDLAELITAESSGTNLVRSDKTDRPAVAAKAASFFDPVV